MATELSVGQIWKHEKTGGVYRIINTGVFMQCSTAEVFENQFAGQGWVVYRSIEDHKAQWYIRLESEFLDGRFTKMETLRTLSDS